MKSNSQDIFICYSRYDHDIARCCNRVMLEMGVSSFLDFDSLVAGSNFQETIQQQIVNCKMILFVVSENAMKSVWTIKEVQFAQKLGKTIIPIVVEGTKLDARYELEFGQINYIVWNPEDISSFKVILIKAVRFHLDKYYRDNVTPTQREIDIDKEIKILDEYQPKEIDYNVFISYRREGGRDIARSIKLSLELIGYNKIFFDYNSIRDGMFNTQIMDAIYSCNDFLLLLSPHSMDNCGEKGDWVAREIRTANKYGRKIIPISLESEIEWPSSMPSDLFELRYIQRHNLLMNEDFDYSIEKLSKRLISKPNYPTNNLLQLCYKVRTNRDCKLYIDGVEKGVLEAGVLQKFSFKNSGEYLVEFFDIETDDKLAQKVITLEKDKVDLFEF